MKNGRARKLGSRARNDCSAARMCAATTDWLVGMSAGDGAALKPVPSGLSMKRSPKRRFHAKGLGERETLSGVTK